MPLSTACTPSGEDRGGAVILILATQPLLATTSDPAAIYNVAKVLEWQPNDLRYGQSHCHGVILFMGVILLEWVTLFKKQ